MYLVHIIFSLCFSKSDQVFYLILALGMAMLDYVTFLGRSEAFRSFYGDINFNLEKHKV